MITAQVPEECFPNINLQGHTSCHISDPSVIAENDTILIPGVSAFSSTMENLNRLGFSEKIRGCASRKQRIIGICAGMQMLFEQGCEFGTTRGLGLLPGSCESLENVAAPAEKYKVPIIGWKSVKQKVRSILTGFSN